MPEPTRFYDFLEWDSEYFGIRIARYSAPVLEPRMAREVRDACLADGIECMYVLLDPHDVAGLESARLLAMRHTGIRLVFHLENLTASDKPGEHATRPAVPADLPRLKELASILHTTSRFYLDPGFDRARAGNMYAVWLEKCHDDPECALFASGIPGEPTGYCLARLSGGASWLELLGVDPRLKGTGLGRSLMNSGLDWLASKGCIEARLVTQGGGPGLIRYYEKCGFVVESVKLWFHYWPGLPPLEQA